MTAKQSFNAAIGLLSTGQGGAAVSQPRSEAVWRGGPRLVSGLGQRTAVQAEALASAQSQGKGALPQNAHVAPGSTKRWATETLSGPTERYGTEEMSHLCHHPTKT